MMASREEETTVDTKLPTVGEKRKLSPTRKKQTSACDGCRKGKTRCDGASPCSRCLKRKITCVYSPQKRRGVRKKQKNEEIQEETEEKIADDEKSNAFLLDVYFRYLNSMLLTPINRVELEVYSKAHLMQYNIALAFAARSTKQKNLMISYERRARILAGELFDDFTPESGTAFALLAAFYWGQDPTKSTFYSTIAQAICKQIGPLTDPAIVMLIEVMASCCIVKWEPYVTDLLCRIRSAANATADDTLKTHLQIVALLLEVKYSLIQAYPVEEDQKYLAILFNVELLRANMSVEQASILFNKLNTAERALQALPNKHNHFDHVWPLIGAYFDYFRSMLMFARHENQQAEVLARKVLETLLEHPSLHAFCNPTLVQSVHFGFCVAHIIGDVSMAVKAIGLLRSMSSYLPVAEISLWGDTRRLKAMIAARNLRESYPTSLTPYGSGLEDGDSTITFSPIQDTGIHANSSIPHVPNYADDFISFSSMNDPTLFPHSFRPGWKQTTSDSQYHTTTNNNATNVNNGNNFRSSFYDQIFHPQGEPESPSDVSLPNVLFS